MSFYKTRNPIFTCLFPIIENSLSEITAIVRKKYVFIMDTRNVTQYESKETKRKKLFLHLYCLTKLLVLLWYQCHSSKTLNKKNELNIF